MSHAADVVIGVPNWPSVNVTAHILKTVMEDYLGLEVELQNGTNPIIFEAMDKGSMHVHPEVWLPNQANLHRTYVEERGTVTANPNGVPGFQGICVSRKTAEEHDVRSIYDLTDPDLAPLFDTDRNGRGELWIGAPGWASTNVERIRARSYGYDETMDLVVMDETLAMADLDAAIAADRPFVFFCYTPHHVFVLHDLVALEEPPHDPGSWKVVQPTDDPGWLEQSNADSAWDVAYLHVHFATALHDDQPEAAALLQRVEFDIDAKSAMTYALVVERQDPAEYARQWVAENADRIVSWLFP